MSRISRGAGMRIVLTALLFIYGVPRLYGQEKKPLVLEHAGEIHAIAVSPDIKLVATAPADNTVRLWNATSGKPVGEPLRHEGHVQGLAFSPDSKLLLSGAADKTARLWDVQTGKQ